MQTPPLAGAAPRELCYRHLCCALMADASAEPANSGRRRILLWFRNDLRLRDNVIINEAVHKVQTGEYDEVRLGKICCCWSACVL